MLLPNTQEVASANPRIAAFQSGLKDHGWIDGQNLKIEWRFAQGQLKRLGELADDLVRAQVDVIVTAATPSALAAKAATTSVPIVILDPGDPVALGLVASLGRPGGNITGVISIAPELAAKRLTLLKEIVPTLAQVAVLFNAAIPPAEIAMKELQATAQGLGLQVKPVPIQGPRGLEESLRRIVELRVDGAIVFPDPLTFSIQDAITAFAMTSRIPFLYGAREFVEVGGLLSYGPGYREMFQRGAYYVDRILKGTNPAELPIEQPTQFELAINLKTARAIGLKVPSSIMLRADRVIE